MRELLAVLGVSAAVICTPGQDTALTIRNAVVGGRRGGIATAAGVATGNAVWTLGAAAGVVAVLEASRQAFTALRLAGAAYLVYLGLHALATAIRGSVWPHAARAPRGTPLRQGLVSNLANPKMVAFFTSLLPQFGESFATLLALGLRLAADTR